jgi:peptidyl-tRNA hydrolase
VSDDPLTMYYVVRKDVPLTLGQSMALAGAGAVRCADALRSDPRYRDAFAAWEERARKVALRASAEELESVRESCPAAAVGDVLLCLPPMRKSNRPPLLEELRPFTDAPRPKEPMEPSPEGQALIYVIRPGVLRTAGKAMAQAGHAALMASDELGSSLDAWRAAGMPGEVRLASEDGDWERLRARPESVVVRDAGLTQVEAGTETVIALPPGSDGAAELERVP